MASPRFLPQSRTTRLEVTTGGDTGRQVGGHPGAVCRVAGKALLIRADSVARNAGDAFDLALGCAAFEQRPDGGL